MSDTLGRRAFLRGAATLLVSAGINPTGPLAVLETPPPPVPALPPSFTVFTQIRRLVETPADSLDAQLERLGKLSGIVDVLKQYPPQDLQQGYLTFIGMGGGWDDGNQMSIDQLFGDMPGTLSPQHLATAATRMEAQLAALRVHLEEHGAPLETYEKHKVTFDTARTETFSYHTNGTRYAELTDGIAKNFLSTLQDGLERNTLHFTVDQDERGAPRISITFNTQEYKEEACHYAIQTDEGIRFGVSEQIKMSLNAMKRNALLRESHTQTLTQEHFERDYTKYGGHITDSIAFASSDPFMDTLARGAVRLLLAQRIKDTVKTLADISEISEITPRTRSGKRIFDIAPPSRDAAQNIQAIADMREALPEILPGVTLQRIGTKIRMELAENVAPELLEILAAHAENPARRTR